MNSIDRTFIAEIQFCLDWRSPRCRHRDLHFASNVNFWRDCFSTEQFERFKDARPGEVITLHDRNKGPLFSYQPGLVHHINVDRFDGRTRDGRRLLPCFGRFYPQGFLQGLTGIFKQNMNLCRCTSVNGGSLEMDLNHPLAGRRLDLYAEVVSISHPAVERGGRCEDWLETISCNGPGAQGLLSMVPADFHDAGALRRDDERRDGLFYETPRYVQHIDDTARAVIRDLYAEHLSPGAEILDLMASWDSHLPENLPGRLVVLGLNGEELGANAMADEVVLQDINAVPELPFADNSFDAVICTVSVEYMTRPGQVFPEVARILRPNGTVVLTFSNRWFDPKVIHIWRDLHEFERMGLVSSWLLETEGFTDIETFSLRGRPRPEDDRYAWQLPYADPVYMVAGRLI